MIITFYSYKGGVGRSMAMANVADILARRGASVLMVDFDLEAPGLEQYFQVPQASARAHDGLINLLTSFKESMAVGGRADFRDLDRFIFPIYQNLAGGGRLDLMPAGRREGSDLDAYATAVRSFDWQDFYFNWEGELFFEWLREELTPKRYDLVLVDSRTGVTEMGGICSYQLADHIVMLSAANLQNLRGTENVANDFTSSRVMARRHDRPLGILVIPARIEQRDPGLLNKFLGEFEETFTRYFPEGFGHNGLGVRSLVIPYQPEFAFEERVITDPAKVADRADLAAAYLNLAEAVRWLAPAESRVASLGAESSVAPRPEYDVASRFASYDVHLAGSTLVRAEIVELKGQMEKAGLHVFADPIEPVPPPEWERRSEQILFHSKVLVLIDSVVTGAQHEALAALLRANRTGKNRPVRVISLDGNPDAILARELNQNGAMNLARRGPDQPIEAQSLIDWINSVERPSGFYPPIRRREGPPVQPAPGGAGPSGAEAPRVPPRPEQTGAGTVSVAPSMPFRGADAFREEAAAYFFGREQLVSNLVAAIEAHPRVWLMGPSGCGKTSAVLAGVYPQLRAKSAERALERVEIGRNSVNELHSVINRIPRNGARHVLFVDEFERVLGLPNAEADAVLGAIAQLGNERPDVVVLFGAREDSARFFHEPPLALPKDEGGSVVRVPDFTQGELLAIIERPAQRSGLAYEPGLVDRISSDAGLQTSALRLIQRTLTRLWEGRREGFLTNSAYEHIGGVGAVVGEIGDRALASYSGDTRILDRILSRLVLLDLVTTAQPQSVEGKSPEQPAMVLRRRLAVPVKDVIPFGDRESMYRPVIDLLTNNGLLVARANEAEEPCIELVHELVLSRSALLVSQLNELIQSDRDFLLWRQRFGLMIQRGEEIKGKALNAARDWLQKRPGDLNLVERHAITSAIRERRTVRTLGVIALGVIGFFVFRVWQKAGVEREQAAIDQARTTVANADYIAEESRWQEAVDSLNAAAAKYEFADSLHLKRGRAYAAQDSTDQAIKDFTEAYRLNPAMIEALVERADAYAAAGNYPSAMDDYEAALRRDPGNSAALLGRGDVRISLKGSPDSSLADFTSSFEADTSRAEALFARGLLNQNLRRDSAAIRDYREVLAHSTDQRLRTGAQARLDSLVPATGGVVAVNTHVRRASIFLHYSDPGDSAAIERVRKEISSNGAFNVPRAQLVSDVKAPSNAEMRFREGDDRLVKDALGATEAALARTGYPIRLQPRALSLKEFPDVVAGRVEVWLPSLSKSLYRRQASQRKAD
ncbi:MAG TPA: tetratricopeptide repeat protein [Gemmatimonadales bacterium]|nr:tetratricopeptide repeat protein [Gemmatimonadales bacterium]